MSTASGGRTPEQELEQRELVLLVERAIDELPEMYRTVMVLREIEGLSTAEVAESLDISEDVVKTRLHRARALLTTPGGSQRQPAGGRVPVPRPPLRPRCGRGDEPACRTRHS